MKKFLSLSPLFVGMILSGCQSSMPMMSKSMPLSTQKTANSSHQHENKTPTTQVATLEKSANNVYQTTLDNGLKVIIKQDKRAPIVMTQIWYNVGSIDEPLGKGGISHFLEHMMFKDAKGISHEDSQRLISHFGGKINAFTSYDYTAYYESLPANQYPLALQIEANRMTNLIFKEEEVQTEKQVVKEERRLRTDDNPISLAYEIFAKTALPNSQKGLPVIGSMQDIENINTQDLKSWYQQWYHPNNATLVLVGDIDPNQAMFWVNKYFADIPAGNVSKHTVLNHKTHQGYQNITTQQEVQVPSLIMGFNAPSVKQSKNADDAYALMLLSDIADGGLSARFESTLVRKQNLLSSVSVYYNPFSRGDEMFMIVATPAAGIALKDAEEAIFDELANIYQGEILPEELQRGQANLVASLVFDNDSVANQAITLGSLASVGLPLDTYDVLPKKLAKINQQNIQKVGKKYLSRDNLTSVYILPKQK